MKKISLCLMLILALIMPVVVLAEEENVARIGDTEYATLADAVAAVPTDKEEATTVTLLKNVEEGPGIVTVKGQNVVIDFNGYSYDASKPTVGSDGTKTNSCQLNKGSKVTFKNGTFTSTKAKRVIQNYADLTLENMVIDGTKSDNEIIYVASFNNGKVEIKGKTSIIATEGNYAFDNYFWPELNYVDGAQVTIDTTGTIKGKIELASSTKGLEQDLPSTLTIKNINHEGTFNFTDERFKNAFTVEGGKYTDLASAVAGVNKDKKEVTIKLLKDVKEGPGIVIVKGQNVVIDFNAHSYDASKPTVGSDGTKTNSCQLNKGSKVTFKNGTFTSTKAKRVIQNYADLTIENMTIDGTKSENEITYVASFNNGKVEIKGKTSIIATEGNYAFDNYFWPELNYVDGAQVTIDTTGTIKGNIELASSTKGLEQDLPSTLTIKNINHEGTFNFADERFKNAFTVEGGKFSTDVTKYVADGFICNKVDNSYVVDKPSQKAEVPSEVVNSEEIEKMLLETLKEKEEFAEILANNNVEVKVEIKESNDVAAKEAIATAMEEKSEDIKVAKYIDIEILVKNKDNGKVEGTIPEVKEAITFTVAMPEGLPKVEKGYVRVYYIVRNHDGKVEFIPTTLSADEKTLSFTSDKFSTYAIAYMDVEETVAPPALEDNNTVDEEKDTNETTTPQTGDNVVIVALVALVAIAGIVISRKIRKTK